MKSYSDLQQSKKLAEILPLESADMRYDEYTSHIDGTPKVGYKEGITKGIPCWSLAALLGVLDFPSLTQRNENEWEVCVFNHDDDDYIEKIANNPIDACYEMIIHLHELKML